MSEHHTTFISFGYRCSSAGILKRLHIKHESYPFDWIVSRIPVIQQCIETDFKQYLDSSLYATARTRVVSYDYSPIYVGDEQVLYNTHYVDISMASYHTSAPLELHRDTYAYPFAMNHHDIRLGGHYDYLVRCVDRFRAWIRTPPSGTVLRKMFIYIHPALRAGEYTPELLKEITDFQTWMCDRIGWVLSGLVFFPIKTDHPYPITNHIPDFIQRIPTPDHPDVHAYKVFMNRDYVDAGEFFFRNAYVEEDAMVSLVHRYAEGKENQTVRTILA